MRSLFALLVAILPLTALADDGHVRVTLLSEQAALVPGTTAWLGVRLQHEPHWHTYWINPGDSGLPTKLAWELPPGFHAGEVAWPAPQRISVSDLYNFGYAGDTLLPVPVEVPADAQPGTTAHISAEVKYLVCREECIPGKASVVLDLPIRATAAATEQQALFATARAAQPRNATWTGAAYVHGDRLEVELHGADLPTITDALVAQRKLVDYAPPKIAKNGDELKLSFAKSDYFVSAPPQIDLLLRAGAQTWSARVSLSSPK